MVRIAARLGLERTARDVGTINLDEYVNAPALQWIGEG